MRVLMLGKGWFPSQVGGMDRFYRELLQQLPEARGVVIGPAEDASARVVAASDHAAPLPTRLASFARAARREGRHADVVDAQFALYAFWPVVMGSLRGKPLLVHFHGSWADENVLAGDASRWRWRARRRLERSVYSRAHAAVTHTGAFRQVLVERYRVSPWRISLLAPGVDLERFSSGDQSEPRRRLGIDPETFVACCARRLVPRMGIDVLIAAWAREFGADPKLQLLIAGDGEQRSALEEQIRALALDGRVRLLGPVSDDTLVALYKAADVNVVPTRSHEGFGLVLLEAAACGTPSIVTRSGGLPEAIAGLGTELVVPPADVQALAARLRRAALGELPSREHTRRWAEGHSWQRVGAEHRKLLSRIAAGDAGVPRKLRVVYLDHVSQLSGGELHLLRLTQTLTAGHDVDPHVILAGNGPLVDRLLEAGVSIEVLRMPERTRNLRKARLSFGRFPVRAILDTLAYTLRLAVRLRQLDPDVVHINSLKAGIYGTLAARLARKPVVWQQHDRLDTAYLPRAGVLLVRALIKLPEVVISNSRSTSATTNRTRRSLVIAPVADSVMPTDSPSSRPGPFVAGIVGRLTPWKGQDVFLHAFARAFPDGDQQARVVGGALFGDGETKYADHLRELAVQLGVAERVTFRGHRDGISAELASMDVLIHASTTAEPFGQVLVEGMAARLPVVASRAGGPEEIISDGIDGLLYPPGDFVALAQILRRLAADPDLRARLGAGGARRAHEFSPESIAEQITKAYELALGSSTSWRRWSGGVEKF